ncbi:S-methyl-5-thioribose-1-phosphate isomerase [Dinochytrium kinnereticum]|nr:S-methyl-5-thioribose-1-phosphate isomerase [Dinochytrium kinnereticum]
MAQTLEAIRYRRGSLQILNQLLLPFESVFEDVKGVEDGHAAIKTMKVRGGQNQFLLSYYGSLCNSSSETNSVLPPAPAIAIVAALSLAVELHIQTQHTTSKPFTTALTAAEFIKSKLDYLRTSRPTAVNLFEAAARLEAIAGAVGSAAEASPESVVNAYLEAAESMLAKDIQDNKNIGKFGAEFVLKGVGAGDEVNVVTHCNTGSLATAGWGTALGIIRDLNASGKLNHVYCTETRPYNQGGRLTAYELVFEKIPSTLITDSMASALLKQKKIAAIVVGADRVAANGDTANKIGTYQLAITAKYHNVPFIVAAPSTSIDLNLASGELIPIEQRSGIEVVRIRGEVVDDEGDLKEHNGLKGEIITSTVHIAAKGVGVWNPSFDVTPASLISAIATEKGIITKAPGTEVFDIKAFLSS